MREKLNENPMMQIAIVGVLVVVVGFLMLSGMKRDEPAPESSATESSLGMPAGGGDASAQAPPSSASPPPSGAPSGLPGVTGTVTPEALVPGPGLPAPVIGAWKGGDSVVLLIVREQGIDDRMVRESARALSGDPGIAFFTVRAEKISRYSRITQGVGVNRVPALVVVRPRNATGSVPEATVSYGFRNSQSVVQAVHDALYQGRDDLPYSPG